MTDVKISQLPVASSAGAADVYVVNQSGVTKQITYAQLTSPLTANIVNSISDLRAVTPLNGKYAMVTGYYAAADGGGGNYYGVSGAAPGTYIENGGSIIIPTGGDGSSAWLLDFTDVLSARQFGAKGDGITDDTLRLQAWINVCVSANALAYLPKGTFIIVPQSSAFTTFDYCLNVTSLVNFELYGDGDASAFKFKTHKNPIADLNFQVAFNFQQASGRVYLHDFKISSAPRLDTSHAGPVGLTIGQMGYTSAAEGSLSALVIERVGFDTLTGATHGMGCKSIILRDLYGSQEAGGATYSIYGNWINHGSKMGSTYKCVQFILDGFVFSQDSIYGSHTTYLLGDFGQVIKRNGKWTSSNKSDPLKCLGLQIGVSAATLNSTTTVSGLTNINGWQGESSPGANDGWLVTGSGIAAGTRIVSVNSGAGTMVISQAALISGATTVTVQDEFWPTAGWTSITIENMDFGAIDTATPNEGHILNSGSATVGKIDIRNIRVPSDGSKRAIYNQFAASVMNISELTAQNTTTSGIENSISGYVYDSMGIVNINDININGWNSSASLLTGDGIILNTAYANVSNVRADQYSSTAPYTTDVGSRRSIVSNGIVNLTCSNVVSNTTPLWRKSGESNIGVFEYGNSWGNTIYSNYTPQYNSPVIIASAGGLSALTSTGVEQTLATINIPAGLMSPNSVLRITSLWAWNATGTKTIYVRFGGTAFTELQYLAAAGGGYIQHVTTISNRGSLSAQIGILRTETNPYNTVGTAETATIDTSAGQNIVLSGLKSLAGGNLEIQGYFVELLRPWEV